MKSGPELAKEIYFQDTEQFHIPTSAVLYRSEVLPKRRCSVVLFVQSTVNNANRCTYIFKIHIAFILLMLRAKR